MPRPASMPPAIRQKAVPQPRRSVAVRNYEGAGHGRRWSGFSDISSPSAAALSAAGTLARRARGLVANNAYAASGVEAWESALVGAGLKPQHKNAALALAFEEATDFLDADDLTDFYGLQAAVARSVVINGEALAVLLADGRIRLLDPEQLDRNENRDMRGEARIVQGVEFDQQGRRVAYHIRQDLPGLPFAQSYRTIRVPAAQVLHVFRPIFAGMVRGLTWFAPVLLRSADYDRAIDAQLTRQITAACFAGFLYSEDPSAFDGDEAGGTLEGGLEPGTMKRLPAGTKIEFSSPAAIGEEAIDFLKITRQEIAAGLGVPVHVLSGDLSDANYSSLRAGLIEWRRRVEKHQHSMLVYQFCRPVWRFWCVQRALAGAPEMAGFFRDERPFLAAKWITPKFDFVDPKKDTDAEIAALNAGLMTRRQAVAARGYDVDQLDEERAEDERRAARLGLSFPALQGKGSPNADS